MKLIIGLGNPGEEYQNTRHNTGFLAIDTIAQLSTTNYQQTTVKFKFEPKLNAEVLKTKFFDKPVILAKPQTFVNKSDVAVSKLKSFYKVKPENVIVIRDDLDIEFGESKLSFGKGSGGHRGMEAIIKSLKTENIWQLKIGVANRRLTTARHASNLKAKKEAVGQFVLSPLTSTERTEFKSILKQALLKLENIF